MFSCKYSLFCLFIEIDVSFFSMQMYTKQYEVRTFKHMEIKMHMKHRRQDDKLRPRNDLGLQRNMISCAIKCTKKTTEDGRRIKLFMRNRMAKMLIHIFFCDTINPDNDCFH